MEETQERKEEQTQTQSDLDKGKEIDKLSEKAVLAHREYLSALSELWKLDRPFCVFTHITLNMITTGIMRIRIDSVRDEISQKEQKDNPAE